MTSHYVDVRDDFRKAAILNLPFQEKQNQKLEELILFFFDKEF